VGTPSSIKAWVAFSNQSSGQICRGEGAWVGVRSLMSRSARGETPPYGELSVLNLQRRCWQALNDSWSIDAFLFLRRT